MDKIRNLFHEIRNEYTWMFDPDNQGETGSLWRDNPSKISIPLEYAPDTDSMTSFFNVLACRHSSGYFGSKSIMCDMKNKKSASKTVLFDPDGNFVGVVDSLELTNIRCALMAMLAVDQFYDCAGALSKLKDLFCGFIGTGHINQTTAAVLKQLIPNATIIARNSPANPDKNLDKFPEGTVFGSIDDVFRCNVLFVSTTETSKDGLIEYEDIENRPELIITQDTGCLLGSSFRENYYSFSDDPECIVEHFEDNFPWDEHEKEVIFHDLTSLGGYKEACVYLYGMAFCDIIMAMDHYGEFEGNESETLP